MKTCFSCKRHVRHRDRACPFCAQPLRETSAWPAVVGLIAATGCGPAVGTTNDGDAATTTGMEPGMTAPMTTTPPQTTTTTTGPATTAVSSTGTDESSSGFMTDPSVGFIYGGPTGGPVTIECSVWDQDCWEGEKCSAWANDGGDQWNATRCSELAATPAEVGEPCRFEGSPVSGVDECDASSMCFFGDWKTNEGICVERCVGSENTPVCDDPTMTCAISHEGTLNLCLPKCDPLLGDCEDGAVCAAINAGFQCFPDHTADTGTYGDACEYFNDCDSGFACLGGDFVAGCTDERCCGTLCDLNDPTCDAGEECLPWYQDGPAPPDLDHVGVCLDA